MSRQVLSSEKIIAQAVTLITADQMPTFSNIARALGTRSQALYSYYPNQDALRAAVFLHGVTKLTEVLKTELFGLSGRAAILRFAQVCRALGLKNIRLTRFILTTPRHLQEGTATTAVVALNDLLMQLCAVYSTNQADQIVVARTLRNLIVGEVINVGAGWFHNTAVPASTSFDRMIAQYLDMLGN